MDPHIPARTHAQIHTHKHTHAHIHTRKHAHALHSHIFTWGKLKIVGITYYCNFDFKNSNLVSAIDTLVHVDTSL